MAKKVNKKAKKQLLKTTKANIREKIEAVLTDIKSELGEKEFKKRLKKAAALFSEGIEVKEKKAAPKKQKQTSSKKAKGKPKKEVAVMEEGVEEITA
ncbi:MAG: hypothetical protein ABUT20_15160 [Bacteroidota bacterium]